MMKAALISPCPEPAC